MIGQTFHNVRRVVVLVDSGDGLQHGFDLDGATVTWAWTGYGESPRLGEGSTGRVTIEGRFHRKSIDPGARTLLDTIDSDRPALPASMKETADGQ